MYAVIATRASLTARKAACTHLCHMRVHSRQRVPAASSISRAPAPTHVITCNNPRDEVAGHKKCNLLRYCAVPQQLSGDAAHVLKFTRAHISELEHITVPGPQSQLHDRPRMHPRSLLYKRTHSFKQAHTNRHTHTHTHTHNLSVSWLDPHGRRLNARRTHTLVSGRGHRLRDSLWSAESRRCTTSSSSLYTLATSKPPPGATNTPPHCYELRPARHSR